jgi:hypothetical protein
MASKFIWLKVTPATTIATADRMTARAFSARLDLRGMAVPEGAVRNVA